MTAATAPDDRRRAELVSALAGVRARLADACAGVGRDPHAITVVAVTKNFPASDVAALAELGVVDVGENRDQEARAKIAELGAAGGALRWHFVGRLQSNKCRYVARYAYAVHSVDRVELVGALADAAGRVGRRIAVFCQVSLDEDPARGGALIGDVPRLADLVAARAELELAGVMAVAPLGADPDAAFARLAEVSAALGEQHPAATAISAGMSGDLEAAIRHGATHVRVGSALLGRRAGNFG